jgi:hypothetical protein
LNYIGRNCLLGHRKKIAKFLMRTFTCRSTFLYGAMSLIRVYLLTKTFVFRNEHFQLVFKLKTIPL